MTARRGPAGTVFSAEAGSVSRSSRPRLIFSAALLVLTVAFAALGTWQVQRLSSKLDLIARVDARIHAAPAPLPPPSAWPAINAASDEYRRVTATGTFDHEREVLVQAVTERGPGFWVVTPLRVADGSSVLVNRGFVPADRRDPGSRAASESAGPVPVTGLMRMTEPGGAFLRENDPAGGRWYSRDVAAIAAAKGIAGAAPYFIDADATANPGGLPVGGLTVVQFRNSHLAYAFTWYFLALMSAAATYAVFRRRFS